MTEYIPNRVGIIQHIQNLETDIGPDIDEISIEAAEGRSDFISRFRNKWSALVGVGAVAIAISSPLVEDQPAYASSVETAVIGMPFAGRWGYSVEVDPHTRIQIQVILRFMKDIVLTGQLIFMHPPEQRHVYALKVYQGMRHTL